MNTYKVTYTCWGIGLARYDGEIEITADNKDNAETKAFRIIQNQFGQGSIEIKSVESV